jgi:hypothetical protein
LVQKSTLDWRDCFGADARFKYYFLLNKLR